MLEDLLPFRSHGSAIKHYHGSGSHYPLSSMLIIPNH
jgi:hypothetical protein